MESKRKILIAGTHRQGAMEHYYRNAFERMGWQVLFFDIRRPLPAGKTETLLNMLSNKLKSNSLYLNINKGLLQHANQNKPQIILVFKGMELFPETIEELRNYTVLLSNYNADHPFEYFSHGSGNDNVKNSLPHYDVHFSYSQKITAKIRKTLSKEAFWIPFGYDASKSNQVAIADSAYAESFVFIGAWDRERSRVFNQLHVDNIQIYGNGEWSSRNLMKPRVRNMFQHKRLYDSEYTDALANSLGSINLLRKQNLVEDSHNMRTFEVTGYGGLLISQRTSEQLAFFEEDKEAVFFDTIEELNEKLNFLETHRAEVQKIKSNAIARVQKSKYSYWDRANEMERVFRSHL